METNLVVLYAEDEEELREITTEMLQEKGFKVLSTSNGQEAFELFSKDPDQIDVVLTDIMMPKMTGQVLSDKIREVNPNIGTVFVSGYTRRELHTHKNTLPENIRFYSKPFNIEKIKEDLIELAQTKRGALLAQEG